MRRFIYGVLVLAAIFAISLGWIDTLYADSGRAPISGTPMLREQKLLLLRDYGPAARIKPEREPGRTILADTVGQQQSFWAYNFGTQAYYQTIATCKDVTQLSSGYYLLVYVENNELTRDPTIVSTITNIKNEYINTILPTETNYFGAPPAGNFTVLLLDIQDSGGGTFVAGYFDSRNEINTSNSNFSHHQHMIYMDSKDGDPRVTTYNSFYGTLAHEFQHFIHYSKDPFEDTWVEEGLAGLARFVSGYGHRTSHVSAFAQAPTTSLTSWQDDLANYGATYLFFLYLNERYGGADTTKAIVANAGVGITGINSALLQRGYSATINDIFKNWVVANYLNNSSLSGGIYGYQSSFSGITDAPGNLQVTSTVSSYPALGNGSVNPYAANYVKFTSLGGTFDIFVGIPYSLSQDTIQTYSYTAKLGSLILNVTGLSSTLPAGGVKQGSSSPTPEVVSTLSASNTISNGTSSSSSGSTGGGGCFIATTAYGSPLGEEVSILREFRDRYLLTNLPGRVLVSFYYTLSPPLAHFISQHESLKAFARIILYPAVGLSHWMLKDPQEVGLLGLGAFLFVGLILIKRKNNRIGRG